MDETCPQCGSQDRYPDRGLLVCPLCGFEQGESDGSGQPAVTSPEQFEWRDAHGTPLTSGDSVVLIKTLPVKGASAPLKQGTKIRNIRLIEPIDGHDIACKVEGFGALNIKSEFVRKA